MMSGTIFRFPLSGGAAPPQTYFKGQDRYRDLAISPDGKRIYAVTDAHGFVLTAAGEPTAELADAGGLLGFTYSE